MPFVRWSGYSKEELMGMNNRRYMDEETAKKVYQVFLMKRIGQENLLTILIGK